MDTEVTKFCTITLPMILIFGVAGTFIGGGRDGAYELLYKFFLCIELVLERATRIAAAARRYFDY